VQAIGRARLMLRKNGIATGYLQPEGQYDNLQFLTEQWQEADCHLDFERVLLAKFREEKRTRP